ncbi:hypothetical protein LIN78_03485 [Leeia sp. TBRC 13508]|uniref:Uncharacterized protein n=1 Tax=Leeia speluncae TaxID=2884804 RepID=A0ABS8D4Q0_9NEIS|nr:hypothetical protein [Leeia speluncae]MCB6182613.1 hypothetical protein [Leeia speluncae]
MNKAKAVVPALLLSTALVSFADTTIPLGTADNLTTLFTYPNCQSSCPTPAPTLADTIAHYLQQNIERDGQTTGKVTVTAKGNLYSATITGITDDYGNAFGVALNQFLNAGNTAATAVSQIKTDNKWRSDWTFLLPLGLSLIEHPTVELLHFPPESVLQKQDYLNNPTTNRWAGLLVDNGVAATKADGYQTIVDIAPIAAPSDAGSEFTGIYPYFTPYIQQLLTNWTANDTVSSKPMVAFGAPARQWVVDQYKLSSLDVLQLAKVSISANQPQVAILGSNHPSYIWYASDPKNYGGDMNQANTAGVAVMMQDLTAACWQAKMGQTPSADPSSTLISCQDNWMQTNAIDSCKLFFKTIRYYDDEKAAVACLPLMPGPFIPPAITEMSAM